MRKKEQVFRKIVDTLYPGLVIGNISEESKNSYGLVLSATKGVTDSTGIPIIDYYHEAECLLNDGYQTGELYEMGVSYEFQGWIEKHPSLHFEWANPEVGKLYINDE